MTLTWKTAESKTKPDEVDASSTSSGIYVRKNIEKVTSENESGEESIKYTYLECLMSETEYNNYSLEKNIVTSVLDEDDSTEGEEYKTNLDTPVLYSNGLYYKPNYISKYKSIMDDVKLAIDLKEKAGEDITEYFSRTFNVYDATGTDENKVSMTISEITDLYLYLYTVKEQFYSVYKAAKAESEEDE